MGFFYDEEDRVKVLRTLVVVLAVIVTIGILTLTSVAAVHEECVASPNKAFKVCSRVPSFTRIAAADYFPGLAEKRSATITLFSVHSGEQRTLASQLQGDLFESVEPILTVWKDDSSQVAHMYKRGLSTQLRVYGIQDNSGRAVEEVRDGRGRWLCKKLLDMKAKSDLASGEDIDRLIAHLEADPGSARILGRKRAP